MSRTRVDNRRLAMYLLGVLGAAAVIGVVAWITGETAPEDELVWLSRLEVPLVVRPTAPAVAAAPSPPADRDDRPAAGGARQRLLVYLDTSRPIAGYLPAAGAPATAVSPLRSLAQLLVDNLVQAYGGTDEVVSWMSTSETLAPWAEHVRRLPRPRPEPRFQAEEFDGNETCLDRAIGDAVGQLEAGRAEVAAVITDMVATCGVTGALGVSNALVAWLSSPAVRNGDFDVALFGARLPYSGILNPNCHPEVEGLGCWFSERARNYRPLRRTVDRPLFVLVLARAEPPAQRGAQAPARLERFGAALAADVAKLGREQQWENITGANAGIPGTLSCTAPRDQRTLLRSTSGLFKCQLAESVRLDCGVAIASRDQPVADGVSRWTPAAVHTTWPAELIRTSIAGDRIALDVDCAGVQRLRPGAPLTFDELTLHPPDLAARWRDWTAISDEQESELRSTLQLARFVESLKAREYHAELARPLLGKR